MAPTEKNRELICNPPYTLRNWYTWSVVRTNLSTVVDKSTLRPWDLGGSSSTNRYSASGLTMGLGCYAT